MIPIILFASGRGSNAEAIVNACKSGALSARVVAIVCDQKDAGVRTKAKQWGVPILDVSKESLAGADRDRRIVEMFGELNIKPRFGVLAGYMRLLGSPILDYFKSERGYVRVVNVHPSLLPAFPGKNSYQQAFDHGCLLTGVTVHLVDEGMDSGWICAQESFSISDCQSGADVEKKGLPIEHRLYVDTLKWVLPESFELLQLKGRPRVYPS